MGSTLIGNDFDRQFSIYTETFVNFLHAAFFSIAQKSMNSEEPSKNADFLYSSWKIKETFEPMYDKSYQNYLFMSRLAETGLSDLVIPEKKAVVTYSDFSASLMKNGPQSVAKKAVLTGVKPSQIGGLQLEASLNNVAAVAAQKVLEAPRANAAAVIKKDKLSIGSARVPNGGACDFCMMLVSRGPVFSKESVSFDGHRSCRCFGRAVYKGYKNSEVQQERVDYWIEKNKGKYSKNQKYSNNKKQVEAGIRKSVTESYKDKYGVNRTRTTYPLTEKGKTLTESARIAESKQYAKNKYVKAAVPEKPKNISKENEAILKSNIKVDPKFTNKMAREDYRPAIFGDY